MKTLYFRELKIQQLDENNYRITKKIKVLLDSWGREGQKDVCFELSKDELKQIISLNE